MKPTQSNRFLAVSSAIAFAAISSSSFAAQLFKDSTGTDINDLANWSTVNGATTPDPTSFTTSDQLRFNENTAASGTFTMDLSAALSVGNITVDSGTLGGGSATGNFVINSANNSTLTLNGGGNPSYATSGIVLNSATGGSLTINTNIALGATPVRFTTSRALTVNGDIDLGANTLEFNTAGSTSTMAGVISGTGALNKAQGAGTLALTNTANTFGGQVSLVGGTTNITKLANLGSNSSLGTGNVASSIILNGSVLTYIGAGGDTTDRAIDMRASAVINNNSSTGAITFTAANVLQGGTASARTFTLGGSNASDNTFNSILGNSGTGSNISSLQKNGTGKWIVTGTQTYTGSTIINQGTLSVSGSTVLGGATGSTDNAGNIVFGQNLNSGALHYETVANLGAADQIRFRNTGGTSGSGGALVYTGTTNETLSKTLQSDSSIGIRLESNSVGGKLTFDGAISDNGARALFLGGTGTGSNEFQTSITGTRSVTKRDAGTWVLSNTNSYTGATSVTGGTLSIGNSGSLGNTTTTIGTNGTLAGGGSIGGATTIEGIHSPGFSPGTQTFTNNLSYASTSTLNWELNDNTTAGRGTAYDAVNVSGGSFSLASGATIDLSFIGTVDFLDAFWGVNQEWMVVDLSGSATAADSNLFSIGAITGGANYSPLLGSFGITRKDGSSTEDSVYLTWTAIPEPSSALLGGIGMLLLLRRRR